MTSRFPAFGILLVILSAACQSRRVMKEIPATLRGEWRTTDVRYQDRSFELAAHSVVFNTGQGTFAAHPLVAMDSIVEPGLIHFRLLYTAGSADLFHFDFSYDPMDDAIRFRNQPEIVWRRAGPSELEQPPPEARNVRGSRESGSFGGEGNLANRGRVGEARTADRNE